MQTESTKRTEAKRNGKATPKAEAKPKAEAPSRPSTVAKPVAVVRELAEKMKGKPRKDVLAACIARGVNRYTAATQYQLWRKPPKAKKGGRS